MDSFALRRLYIIRNTNAQHLTADSQLKYLWCRLDQGPHSQCLKTSLLHFILSFLVRSYWPKINTCVGNRDAMPTDSKILFWQILSVSARMEKNVLEQGQTQDSTLGKLSASLCRENCNCKSPLLGLLTAMGTVLPAQFGNLLLVISLEFVCRSRVLCPYGDRKTLFDLIMYCVGVWN